jgi:hypothetical protein
MKSWKILVACIRKDFSLVKRDLLFFSLAYIVMLASYYALSLGLSGTW